MKLWYIKFEDTGLYYGPKSRGGPFVPSLIDAMLFPDEGEAESVAVRVAAEHSTLIGKVRIERVADGTIEEMKRDGSL